MDSGRNWKREELVQWFVDSDQYTIMEEPGIVMVCRDGLGVVETMLPYNFERLKRWLGDLSAEREKFENGQLELSDTMPEFGFLQRVRTPDQKAGQFMGYFDDLRLRSIVYLEEEQHQKVYRTNQLEEIKEVEGETQNSEQIND